MLLMYAHAASVGKMKFIYVFRGHCPLKNVHLSIVIRVAELLEISDDMVMLHIA